MCCIGLLGFGIWLQSRRGIIIVERRIRSHNKGWEILQCWRLRSGISILHFGSQCLDTASERCIMRIDLTVIEADLIFVISGE
jgi:hypothetical protein